MNVIFSIIRFLRVYVYIWYIMLVLRSFSSILAMQVSCGAWSPTWPLVWGRSLCRHGCDLWQGRQGTMDLLQTSRCSTNPGSPGSPCFYMLLEMRNAECHHSQQKENTRFSLIWPKYNPRPYYTTFSIALAIKNVYLKKKTDPIPKVRFLPKVAAKNAPKNVETIPSPFEKDPHPPKSFGISSKRSGSSMPRCNRHVIHAKLRWEPNDDMKPRP